MGLEKILSIYISLIAKLLRELRIKVDVGGISVSYESDAQQSLDERIGKLDAARKNLSDGISAIDQLKSEAEHSKKDIAVAAQQIEDLNRDKANLTEKLESMQSVLDADVDAFREVAGVPSADSIRNERIIGFISGITASLVAAGLIWIISLLA